MTNPTNPTVTRTLVRLGFSPGAADAAARELRPAPSGWRVDLLRADGTVSEILSGVDRETAADMVAMGNQIARHEDSGARVVAYLES
jgi:hypothetical protein